MQIIIRMDDITPDMDWKKFEKVRGIFEKNNICPLIGVVPECRDNNLHYDDAREDFWQIIMELKELGWDIAQHGTYHVYETEACGLLGINRFSEFAGLSYENQYDKLKKGRQILLSHGIDTRIFMAPGHTYDESTLKALKELGFTSLTDGLSKLPYTRDGIVCMPCRLASFSNLKGLDTVCLHTSLMSDSDIDELRDFIESNRTSIISYSEACRLYQPVLFSNRIAKSEKKVLKKRELRNGLANSERLAWYMQYTNHSSSKIKWLKRAIFLPLLLTNKYKGN